MAEIVKRSLLLFVAMTAVAVAKAQFFIETNARES